MKKRWNVLAFLLVILLLLTSFSSCSSEKYLSEDSMAIGGNSEEKQESPPEKAEILDQSSSAADGERKIIEQVQISLQTKTFDSFMSDVESEVASLGGYMEKAEIHGRKEESEDMRWANLTLRIPAEKSGGFTDFVSENAVVINRSVSTEDVTLKYVDMESRVSAMKLEKEALEELLKNAATVEDIITVRERLTDVIYQIESYESQLRTYDNLVSYTTVTMTVREVERTSVVEKQGIWQKIGTNLKENFVIVWELLVDVFVFLISAIPYFLLIGAIVFVFVFLHRIKKRKKLKKQEEKK